MKKYLYVYGETRYGDIQRVLRYEVTRETNSNIWIKTIEDFESKNSKIQNSEIRISKKTYATEYVNFHYTKYYEETPELLEQYHQALKERFAVEKIESLYKRLHDPKVIEFLLNLEIPTFEEEK